MKILFDHLQKTGGTALLEFLRPRFDDRKVSPLIQHENVLFAARLLGEFEVVGGHLELTPDYDWPGDIYHVTVLRDPIERFLSHYSHAREQPEAADPFSVLSRRHDIATLLRLGDEYVLRNVKDFYSLHFAESFDAPAPATPAKLFAAIEQRYRLVGISERMDDVAFILCMVLGLDPGHVASVRVTGTRFQQGDLEPDTRALLLDLTANDRALYQLATERFATIVRTVGRETSTNGEWTHVMNQPQDARLCADPPSGSPRILAAELSCPESDTNDCALSGAACVLAFQIDPRDAPLNSRIALRITNALHQIVYREERLVDLPGASGRQPVELLWRFVCPLGVGLYRCSLALGLFKLNDVYEFTVILPPQSVWAGMVDLRPTVTVIEQSDVSAEGLAGSITTPDEAVRGGPGSLLLLPAAIRNDGTPAWRAEGITRVVVSYKLFNEERICRVDDGLRTMLPKRMEPGDAVDIGLRIRVPAEPGRYVIEPKFVRERVAWFGEGPPVALQVGDIAEPPVALASDELREA